MKKIFYTAFLAVLACLNVQAEDFKGWHGIDEATVEQYIDVETCKVYVVARATAEMKNQNNVSKQQAAFDELGQTIVQELKKAFPKASFQLIADAKEAPADAMLIEACLDEINWGSGALRQVVGMGAGNIHGRYSVKVSNANGLVCAFKNHRFHDTTFSSAKGPAVIKVYNQALVKDLIVALREIQAPSAM